MSSILPIGFYVDDSLLKIDGRIGWFVFLTINSSTKTKEINPNLKLFIDSVSITPINTFNKSLTYDSSHIAFNRTAKLAT